MQAQIVADENSTARQLRPVVMAVIAGKIAVTALLLTTINLHTPLSAQPAEIASAR